jgi:hypothetical protein
MGLWQRALSVTDATASNIGTPGELRTATDGKVYKLFLAKETLANGVAFELHQASGTDGYSVKIFDGANVKPNGVQNQVGASIASDVYFWGQVKGPGNVLIASDGEIATKILVMFNDSGQCVSMGVSSDSAAPSILGRVCGHSIAAVGTDSTTVEQVYLDCER